MKLKELEGLVILCPNCDYEYPPIHIAGEMFRCMACGEDFHYKAFYRETQK